MSVDIQALKQTTLDYQRDLVDFTQRLVQTPSLPGQEGDLAALIQTEMKTLGYDDIQVDNLGNVIGYVAGGPGPSLMLNGHMDHVDPGDLAGWPQPPFSGKIVANEIWGRGSVDIKGPVAAMIYAPAVVKSLKQTLPGDLYVVTPIMEEVGGVGTAHLTKHLKTALALVGEPSHNTLRLGHRGRVELWVTVTGKSIHASIPHKGGNPHYILADFLQKLAQYDMISEDIFEASSVAPTLYQSDQVSANVTPGEIRLTLDWRNVPSETPQDVVQKMNVLLQSCLTDGATGTVSLATRPFTTYTQQVVEQSAVFPSFALSETHPWTIQAHKTLNQTLGRTLPVDIWTFATDGGHLMAAGIPTIGFGPGDESLAHTNQERMAISQLVEGLMGYTALCLAPREIS